jgi:hypothetical protein
MRQSPVCKKVQVFSLLWLHNMQKQDSKCFVKIEDLWKLERQYQRLLKRYVREKRKRHDN